MPLVVIIGILIAFYLGNWAESQRERRHEISILKGISSDLNISLNDLSEDKMIMDSAYSATKRIVRRLETSDSPSPEISEDFLQIAKIKSIQETRSEFS